MDTLRKGSRGEQVKILQRHLHLIDDGIFGVLTRDAVIAFQKSHGLVADGIVGSKTWNAILSDDSLLTSTRRITELIVHCADTPEGRNDTIDKIRLWHTTPVSKGGRGWSDIGYHYVIHLDGSVHAGRPVSLKGAHCAAGRHNENSIGICYVGGRTKDKKQTKDTRTPEQKAALVKLLKQLRDKYPGARIYGHHDFDKSKDCPCFDAKNEYKDL
jgi:N-acetylmuramoyl-L-alanine amidase